MQKSIAEGATPLVVNATAGTTVRGAYDPFDKIGDICRFGLGLMLTRLSSLFLSASA